MSTLIVEDGTGVMNANSLISRDEALAFINDRLLGDRYEAFLNSAPDQQSAALILATEHLDGCYGGRFKGYPRYANHLSWPRQLVTLHGTTLPNNEVPQKVKLAVLEIAAELAKGTNLDPTIGFDPASPGAEVEITQELGPLKESRRFSAASSFSKLDQAAQTWVSRADRLLSDYLTDGLLLRS